MRESRDNGILHLPLNERERQELQLLREENRALHLQVKSWAERCIELDMQLGAMRRAQSRAIEHLFALCALMFFAILVMEIAALLIE